MKPGRRQLSQAECDRLRVGQYVVVLWRRSPYVPHERPGPWCYRVEGQSRGHAVLEGNALLTDVSLASQPDKNLVWLVEDVTDATKDEDKPC